MPVHEILQLIDLIAINLIWPVLWLLRVRILVTL